MKFKRWKKMIVMLLIATMFLQSVVVYADDSTSAMPSQTETSSDAQAAANDEPTTSQTPSDGSSNAEDPADQDGKGDADNPADQDVENANKDKDEASKDENENKDNLPDNDGGSSEDKGGDDAGKPKDENIGKGGNEDQGGSTGLVNDSEEDEELDSEELEETADIPTEVLELRALLDQMEAFELTEENQEEYYTLGMQAMELMEALEDIDYKGKLDDQIRFQMLANKQTGGSDVTDRDYIALMIACQVDSKNNITDYDMLDSKNFSGTTNETTNSSKWQWTASGNRYMVKRTASTNVNTDVYLKHPSNLWNYTGYTYKGYVNENTSTPYGSVSINSNVAKWTDSFYYERNNSWGKCSVHVANATGAYTWYIFQKDAYNYTLNYNANGGSDGNITKSEAKDQTATSYTFTDLNGNPTRTGYRLDGWSTTNGANNAGNRVTSVTCDTNNKTKTVYAIWEAIDYTITYTDGVAGQEVFKDQVYNKHYGDETPEFNGDTSTLTYTKDGKTYEFVGWDPAVAETVTGTQTYTAKWKEKVNTLKPLTVTKTVNKTNIEVGEEITYTIIVSNTNSKVVYVEITDKLSDMFEFVAAGDGGKNNNGTVTWTNVEVPANGNKEVALYVKAVKAGKVTNSATVTWPDGGSAEGKAPEVTVTEEEIKYVDTEFTINSSFRYGDADLEHTVMDNYSMSYEITNPNVPGFRLTGTLSSEEARRSSVNSPAWEWTLKLKLPQSFENKVALSPTQSEELYGFNQMEITANYTQVDGYVYGFKGSGDALTAAREKPNNNVTTINVAGTTSGQKEYVFNGYAVPQKAVHTYYENVDREIVNGTKNVEAKNSKNNNDVIYSGDEAWRAVKAEYLYYEGMKYICVEKPSEFKVRLDTVPFKYNYVRAITVTWEREDGTEIKSVDVPNGIPQEEWEKEKPVDPSTTGKWGDPETDGDGNITVRWEETTIEPTQDGTWQLDITKEISNYLNKGKAVTIDDLPDDFAVNVTVKYHNGEKRVSETRKLIVNDNPVKSSWEDGGYDYSSINWNGVFNLPDWQYDLKGNNKTVEDFADYDTIIEIRESNYNIDDYTCTVSSTNNNPVVNGVKTEVYHVVQSGSNDHTQSRYGIRNSYREILPPSKPTDKELQDLKLVVWIDCEPKEHTDSAYWLGSSWFGEVTKNTGSNKEDYPYVCAASISVDRQESYWLNQTIQNSEIKWSAEHQLKEGTKTLTATLYWDGSKWTLPTGNGLNPDVYYANNYNYLRIHTVHKDKDNGAGIEVEKTLRSINGDETKTTAKAGDKIVWNIKVTNLSNVEKTVTLTEKLEGAVLSKDEVVLEAGKSETVTATYTVPDNAVPGSKLKNVVVAETDKPNEKKEGTNESVEIVDPDAPVEIEKTVNKSEAVADELMTYKVTITNKTDKQQKVTFKDDMAGGKLVLGNGTTLSIQHSASDIVGGVSGSFTGVGTEFILAARKGAKITFEYTARVAADAAGKLTNTATATVDGKDYIATADTTVKNPVSNPKLTGITKALEGIAPASVERGESVTLTYKITVTGEEGAKYEVTDADVTVVSGNLEGTLDSTGKAEITVTKIVTAAEAGTLEVVNTAYVKPGDGTEPVDSADPEEGHPSNEVKTEIEVTEPDNPTPTPDPTPTPTPGGGDDPTPPVPELTPLIPEIIPAGGPTTPVVPNVTPVAATPAAPTPTAALVSPTPEAVELADEAVPLAAEEEKQPELEAVDEEKTPLAGGKGAAWALINFALMNLAIFESVMLLIGYFVKTKNDDEEEKRKLKKKGIFRIISLPIAVISLIVFILTEDITLPTAFVDKYTIVMLIIAIVQTVMVALSNKKYEDEDEQEV